MNSRRARRTTSFTAERGKALRSIAASVLAASVLLVGVAGARAADVPAAYPDMPERLKALYEKVATEGDRNRVLNQMRAGLAAMELRRFDLAKGSFDDALMRIETVYANSETAAKARSLWTEEGRKDFKGEPYERAMAYYYRGLLYLREGDYENARACFKSGVLQDAFAEEEQYSCDFALLIFLEGWASQCLGDTALAQEAYRQVLALRPNFIAPAPDDNCLVIVETGTSPRKLADGVGHYELKLFRGKGFQEQQAWIEMNGGRAQVFPMENIAWQAMTRGGRPIDAINKGKVVFKQVNEGMGTAVGDVANVAMVGAPLLVDVAVRGNLQAVAGALGLISVTQMIIAQKVNPRADTRYWNNLPDSVHVFTCKAPEGGQPIPVGFVDAQGRDLPELTKTLTPETDPRGKVIGFVRSRSAIPNP